MGAVLTILLIPILILLIGLLFIFLFTYAKVMQIWYKLTGKKPNNPFGAFTGTFGGKTNNYGNDHSSKESGNQNNESCHSSDNKHTGQRIFNKDEGEYVDFEIIDEDKNK